jgi:tetratricopeptide (TPR) repeat protein
LLSIDIDGNDYFVWQALTYRPRVVVIEYNASVPPELSRAIVYDPKFKWDNTDYFGASLRALADLGNRKGYELVYCERAGGNAFFVARSELPPGFVAKPLAEIYKPPNYFYRGLRHRPELCRVMIDPMENGLLEQAIRAHQTGELRQAENLYQRLIDAEPLHAQAHHQLGLLKLEASGFAAAAALIRRAIELDSTAANYHVSLGRALAEMADATAAIECYHRALQIDPNCVDALKHLGLALKDQSAIAEAIECFRHVLRLYPSEVDAHNNLGNLLRNTGRIAEAERSYRQALRLNPDHASAHNNLGIALAQQGRIGEAIACFHEALRLNPQFAEARKNLSIIGN